MEFLFDTANLEEIVRCDAIYPYTGITSNPTILKREGKIDVFSHLRKIREVIGKERTLHVQITAPDSEGMVKDAHAILEKVDEQVYIKIPTNEQGLHAMQVLKKEGVGITATAIYSKMQGFLAIAAGADFIAPYFNRMENMDIDPREVIASFAQMIDSTGSKTKILAASFKNAAQISDALLAGAQTVTVAPALLRDALGAANIQRAVDDFSNDWKSVYGDRFISDL